MEQQLTIILGDLPLTITLLRPQYRRVYDDFLPPPLPPSSLRQEPPSGGCAPKRPPAGGCDEGGVTAGDGGREKAASRRTTSTNDAAASLPQSAPHTPTTAAHAGSAPRNPDHGPCRGEHCPPSIGLTEEELRLARSRYPDGSGDAFIEYSELCTRASNALLPYDRCIFHGMAFLWRGRAWLLTAPSGTGKTTQYILWKMRYGDEIQIINGDKPLLDLSSPDGTVWVHPSPWKGKEHMGQMISAPLGGILLLRQDGENTIRPLPVPEAVLPLYRQFLFTPNTPALAEAVCRLEEALLTRLPVWELKNRGDNASAQLAHDTLLREVP